MVSGACLGWGLKCGLPSGPVAHSALTCHLGLLLKSQQRGRGRLTVTSSQAAGSPTLGKPGMVRSPKSLAGCPVPWLCPP